MERLVKWCCKVREHYLNELHIYCRMIDMGFSLERSRTIAIRLTIKI